MDPLSQAAIGAAAAQSGSKVSTLRHALWIGALAGMAPDLDVLIQSDIDPLLALEYHRQFTHSLFFVPVGALICACVFYPLVRQRLTFKRVWFFAALGYGTHGLLDACTTYGTQLLWPLTDARFAWHNVSVIDPLFTLPLLMFLLISAVRRQPRLAIYGLCWAMSYLGFGLVQHQRALPPQKTLSATANTSRFGLRWRVCQFACWKALYGDRYASTPCVGITDLFPGIGGQPMWTAIFRFCNDVAASKDIERFRWFSDDWLALDDQDAAMVVDMRYLKYRTQSKVCGVLWTGKAGQNTLMTVQRETGAEELSLFWAQLMGRGAVPLQ